MSGRTHTWTHLTHEFIFAWPVRSLRSRTIWDVFILGVKLLGCCSGAWQKSVKWRWTKTKWSFWEQATSYLTLFALAQSGQWWAHMLWKQLRVPTMQHRGVCQGPRRFPRGAVQAVGSALRTPGGQAPVAAVWTSWPWVMTSNSNSYWVGMLVVLQIYIWTTLTGHFNCAPLLINAYTHCANHMAVTQCIKSNRYLFRVTSLCSYDVSELGKHFNLVKAEWEIHSTLYRCGEQKSVQHGEHQQ